MDCTIPCKVIRLKAACCGMVNGHIYDAKRDETGAYITVHVGTDEDGKQLWTCDHWFGQFEDPYFLYIKGTGTSKLRS